MRDDPERTRPAGRSTPAPTRRWPRESARAAQLATRRTRAAQRRPARSEQGLPRAAARARGGARSRRARRPALALGRRSATGPYRPMLEMLAAELGLAAARALRWAACQTREMHAWHELSTLFVHPTLYEGSSLVTLEAMAHRRAVVASAAGGIPDKVRPGENGWLVAPGDPSALAAAISGARQRSGTARPLRSRRPRHRRARILVDRRRRRDCRALSRAPRINLSR